VYYYYYYYSAALKNTGSSTINTETADVFTKSTTPNFKSEDIFKEAQRKINLTELDLKITCTKTLKNGLIIKCPDQDNRSKLLEAARNALGNGYRIEESRKWKPRLISAVLR
jgi:hypothetical protein